MAQRTDEELVGAIIEVDDGDDLAPFIADASLIVDDLEAAADPALSGAKLARIETWLAAHFYAIKRPRLSGSRVDVIDDRYDPLKVDLGLDLTKYGQQAKLIDTSGYLAALNATTTPPPDAGPFRTPTASWLGTARESY